MAIIQIITDTPGQINYPDVRRVRIISSDNLATVTAAGYLNPQTLQGFTINNTDEISMWYGAVISPTSGITSAGTFGIFTPSISNGVITLNQWANPGDVLLPVVSGDFANFNGTTGQIKDAGFSPTDATKTKVVMLNAAPTINHVAIFTNANGTIGDGGVLGTAAAKAASNNALSTVASTAGSGFTIGDVITAADAAGTISDSGILATNIVRKDSTNTMAAGSSIVLAKVNGTEAANAVTASGTAGIITTSALTTAGGATYAITWTNTFITTTSTILLSIMGGSNNATNNITFKVTNGAGTSTLTIFNNTAATSLNGTLLIGYLVV